ncbi:hypothetical protein ACH3XW_18185 [Acanthocheilonema viteae]
MVRSYPQLVLSSSLTSLLTDTILLQNTILSSPHSLLRSFNSAHHIKLLERKQTQTGNVLDPHQWYIMVEYTPAGRVLE